MLPPALTPDLLRQLELFKIRTKRLFLGIRQGGHLSPKKGHGIEFSDYRNYELGDNPRGIDWGVYARSDKLYIRRYQEEQNISLLVIVDASPSMWTPLSDAKWEVARDIACAVSYLGLMEQERVTLCIPGVRLVPGVSGAAAVHRIGEELLSCREPAAPHDSTREILAAVAKIKMPGVVVYISDFLAEVAATRTLFSLLQAKNLEVRALHVQGRHDRTPFNEGEEGVAVDSETGEEVHVSYTPEVRARYEELLAAHGKALRTLCTSCGIAYGIVDAALPLEGSLIPLLETTGVITR
jgi:uncharacterized protein (DUF58 family)